MDSELYEQNCGRCVHAVMTRAEGTICGLTHTKPDLWKECADLVVDPQAERDYAVRDRRREIAEKAADDDNNPDIPGLSEMMADGQLRGPKGSIRWPAIIFLIVFLILVSWKVFLKID